MSKPNFEWHDRSCYRVMLEAAMDPRSVRSHSGKKEEKKKDSGTPANADPYPPYVAMRLAPLQGALACRRSTAALV